MTDTSTARIEVLAEMAARTDLPMTAAALRALVAERDALTAENERLTGEYTRGVLARKDLIVENERLTAENARLRQAHTRIVAIRNAAHPNGALGKSVDMYKESMAALDALRATPPTPAEYQKIGEGMGLSENLIVVPPTPAKECACEPHPACPVHGWWPAEGDTTP